MNSVCTCVPGAAISVLDIESGAEEPTASLLTAPALRVESADAILARRCAVNGGGASGGGSVDEEGGIRRVEGWVGEVLTDVADVADGAELRGDASALIAN